MEDLDYKMILKIISEKKTYLIGIILIFFLIGAIYSFFIIKPEYIASTSLSISGKSSTTSTADLTLNTKLASTYNELVKTRAFVRQVIENTKIDIDEDVLMKNISVVSTKDTGMLKILVSTSKADDSIKLANEAAQDFIKTVKDLYNMDNYKIIDYATNSSVTSNLNYGKSMLIFLFVGIMVAFAYIVILNIFDTTVKSQEEIEMKFGIPVLSAIPKFSDNKIDKANKGKFKRNKELVTISDPISPISEIFRTLRTNIQYSKKNKEIKTILITSATPQDGKSVVAANLAVTMAEAGKKVILLDADMRKGRQFDIFKVEARPGLSDYLSASESERRELAEYVQRTDVPNLYIMTAGGANKNPSELLDNDRMRDIINQFEEVCDVLIIDGTPSLIVTDSVILSRMLDITLFVASYGKTKEEDLKQVIYNVKRVGGRPTGIILNQVPMSKAEIKKMRYYGVQNQLVTSKKKFHQKSKEKTDEIENKNISRLDKIKK